jgi:endonuclease/exonuclease/phosphatase (EEP) superfamily protein YafD
MTAAVLTVFTLVLLAGVLLQWRDNTAWWARGWDFPRVQYSVIAALVLVAQLSLLPWTAAWHLLLPATVIGCLIYQAWWILPYTRLWSKEVDWAPVGSGGKRISLLAANVLTPNRNAARLLQLVEQYQPDIVVLLETDAWWEQQLAPLDQRYPHALRCPLDNLYGMHVLSRLPLEDAQIRYLVEDDVPSMHALVLLDAQTPVRMHFLHPAPPSPTENETSIERDVELLIVGKSIGKETRPTIVAGDLNDVAWSPTTRLFRKTSGLLDPRVGRGMFNTFHAKYWCIRWPLDHIFHSDHFKVVRIERLPAFGSDHFPIFIELDFDEAYAHQQEGLQADADDRQQAAERMGERGAEAGDVPVPGQAR